MFCPSYGGPCEEENCRDWNKEEQKCRVQVENERRAQEHTVYMKIAGFMEAFAESERLNTLRSQASLRSLLTLPMIPPGAKEFIEKMLEAPTSEVAKKLLDEAGL